MKNTLSGEEAYNALLDAPFNPVTGYPHGEAMNRVRREILEAGYLITREQYRSNDEGTRGLGTFQLNKNLDGVELLVMLSNDYNIGGEEGCRFTVAGKTGHSLVVTGETLTHPLMAGGKLTDYLKSNSDKVLQQIVRDVKRLNETLVNHPTRDHILMSLFLNGMIGTSELEIFKNQLEHDLPSGTGWEVYELVKDLLWDRTPIEQYLDKLSLVTSHVHVKLRPLREAPVTKTEVPGRITPDDVKDYWQFKWYDNGDYATVEEAIAARYCHVPFEGSTLRYGYLNTVDGSVWIGIGEVNSDEYEYAFTLPGYGEEPVAEEEPAPVKTPGEVYGTVGTPDGTRNHPWEFYWNGVTIKDSVKQAKIVHKPGKYYRCLNDGLLYKGINRRTTGRDYELVK